ncbi:MAG: Por secretion system protein [Prevotella sp.]
MKKLFLLLSCFILGVMTMNGQNKYKDLPSTSIVESMSPNGRWLVGNDSKVAYGVAVNSFIYDTQQDTIHWVTKYENKDWSKAGSIKAVNDDGTMVGVTKDMNHMASLAYTPTPTNIATIWNGGVATQLPYGELDTSIVKQAHDGTFATDVSNDGRVVTGYIAGSNFAEAHPCYWTKGDDNTWTVDTLVLPEGYVQGEANYISSDGSLIVGYVSKKMANSLCYWLDGEPNLVVLTPEDSVYAKWGASYMTSVSPNGRFFAFALANRIYARIYDVENETYYPITPIEKNGRHESMQVTDNGDAYGVEKVGNPYADANAHSNPVWFQFSTKRTYYLSYYMKLFAPDLTVGSMEFPTAASADGNMVAGYTGEYSPRGWYFNVTRTEMEIPEMPTGLEGVSNALHAVDLSWPSDTTQYSTLTLKSYNVYCDGSLIQTIDNPTSMNTLSLTDVTPGYPSYTIEAIYSKADGSTIASPMSLPVEVPLHDNYDFPFFDEFNSLQTEYWTKWKEYGDDYDTEWAASMYNGYNGGYGMSTGASTDYSYSHAIVSRPIDATNASSVVCTFLANYHLLRYTEDAVLDSDSISLEYSLDRNTWTEVKTWTLKDLPTSWGAITLDLTDALAGKLFQIRFHKHGTGAADYYVYFDNLKLGLGNEEPALEGLTGTQTGKDSVKLAWKSPDGGYYLGYNTKHRSTRYTIGNLGEPVIGAIKFTPHDLSLYDGKYLTAVKTAINHYDYYPDTLGIHASVVVYKGGELICEQEMDTLDYENDFIVKLNEPIQIDSTQEMYIGVKIHDYDKLQMPLLYDNSTDCKPGVTDLYSEDNGATWSSIYDFYAGSSQTAYRANCCWVINGIVTDNSTDEVGTPNSSLIGYNLYHNGKQVNLDYLPATTTFFTDSLFEGQNDYYVVAFYDNGNQTAKSNIFSISILTDINETVAHENGFNINGDQITLSGNGELNVYTIDGVRVATVREGSLSTRGFAPGVYIIEAITNGERSITKILIK